MKLRKITLTSLLVLTLHVPAHGALYVHPVAVPVPDKVAPNSDLPEQAIVNGRARDQRLDEALVSIFKNKMNVEFTAPELKSMKVNWRSTGEPAQIVLTNLARGYNIDITLNEAQETVFIGIDTGQCDPLRESTLYQRKKQWASMGITEMPTLPPRLPQLTDYTGQVYRLC